MSDTSDTTDPKPLFDMSTATGEIATVDNKTVIVGPAVPEDVLKERIKVIHGLVGAEDGKLPLDPITLAAFVAFTDLMKDFFLEKFGILIGSRSEIENAQPMIPEPQGRMH